MTEFENEVALVTGSARGVGAVIAQTLSEAGARVILCDVREEEGRAAANHIGASARFEKLDVTEEEDWRRVVAMIEEEFGRLDILVNNAAILHIGSLESTPPDVFRRVHEVNTVGPYLGTRAVLPTMKSRGKGSIVHVCSIDGLIGMNGVSAYAASKWGLRGFAKSCALELGRSGIRVNTVCPAGGNTEMYGPWYEKLGAIQEETQAYGENRAIPGSTPVEAIAQAVLYLASDSSANVTGIDLPVDGGTVAGRFLAGFNSF